MPSNSLDFAQSVLVVAGTYLLHSTMLLAAVWLVLKLGRVRSHALAERLWKMAAILGLVTAPVQLALGWSSPVFDVTLGPNEDMPYAAGDKANSSTDGPPVVAPPEGTGSVDQQAPNAASFALKIIDSIEPTVGLDGDGDEYRGSVRQDTYSGNAHLPDEKPDYLFAASSDMAKGELGHVLQCEERRREGKSDAETPVASDRSSFAVSPPIAARLGSAGAMLTAAFIICGAFMLLVQTSIFHRRCRGSRELGDGPARRILDRLLQKNSVRRQVRLLSSDAFGEPVAFGLARWTIVLPSGIEQRLANDELKALLAHELAHLVRGDVHWLWMGRVLCSCLTFQPLNFIARRRWQYEAEFLCDDWAVGRGVSPISLARCLTRIAEWRLTEREYTAGLAAVGSKARIVLRVERLVSATGPADVWTRPFRRILLRLAVIVTVACFVCIAPRVVLPTLANDTQDRNIQENLGESELGLRREDIAVGDLQSADDWQLLEEELVLLDRDLSYAFWLLKQTSDESEVHESADLIRRHVLVFEQRRNALAEQMKKELDR